MNRLFAFSLAVLTVAATVGCNLEPASTATLYLDNPSNKTVKVSVDGEFKATVLPGQFQFLSVDLGTRQIQYKSNDQVVYSTEKTFEPNDIPLLPASYLVNPVDSVCYCSTIATYGYDHQGKELEQLVTQVASSDPDAPRKELLRKFKNVLGEMQVFEVTEPTRFKVQRYTLKPLPNSVKAMKHAVSRDRSALIRIPRELYDSIVKLHDVEVPSENDMKTAAELRLAVDSLVPFEG